MPFEGKTRFNILRWDEAPYSEVDGAGKLTRASIDKTYEGDLSGTGALEYLMSYSADGTSIFVGFERVTGQVGGRSGSFVIRHEGVDDGKVARATCTVVPGSGAEGLTGIQGGCSFALGRSDDFVMAFSFDFP